MVQCQTVAPSSLLPYFATQIMTKAVQRDLEPIIDIIATQTLFCVHYNYLFFRCDLQAPSRASLVFSTVFPFNPEQDLVSPPAKS